ncbi:small-subunit processome [Irpex rosettiformis]|uniref:Small-subunit processome n=1 Tax=Irpex rosettiformis TaxID=378272 RepID=A0ACB8UJF1_9APHY|nr:small-subunit processome [Irpex rosettiformis]
MSSLRNSLHRRNHKERSQLAHRSRLGILEKHKDYVLRARDYHSKQDRIIRLRQKAADRNKDEFYFGMIRGKTEGGVHVQDRGNVALPIDIAKVLKSQDANYIRTMRTTNAKKIDKLKSQLCALADLVKPLEDDEDDGELDEEELAVLRNAGIIAEPGKKQRKKRKSTKSHILFVDTEDQAQELVRSKKSTIVQNEDMDVEEEWEDLGWKLDEATNKKDLKGKGKATQNSLDSLEEQRREEASQHRTRLLKELSARLHRDTQLRYAERELEMQKLLMGKGQSRKLSGVERVDKEEDEDEDESEEDRRPKKVDEKTWKPRVYKWRVERKR